MTKEQRLHLERLKQNAIIVVSEEIVTINKTRKKKKTFSDGRVIYYTLPPFTKPITCNAMGTGCRSGIPFNPNNSGNSNPEWTWERDSIYEQIPEVEE